MLHVPVMTAEVLDVLLSARPRLVLDATAGAGGHARSILEASPEVHLIAVDRDPEAIIEARRALASFGDRVRFITGNFANLQAYLARGETLDGVIADLGLSSLQLDRSVRGFSYTHDGPLDMRMSAEGTTAAEMLAATGAEDLAGILRRFGDVSSPKRIARCICRAAESGRLFTTFDLRRAVEEAIGAKGSPALLSRVFQAIRIVLNEELDNLRYFLEGAVACASPGARIAIISYHSGEDAIVKEFFRRESRDCVCPPKQPVCSCGHEARLRVVTRRPITPDEAEVRRNPRARSAKLRVAQVLAKET